ncbi:putative esterase [bioreactor metagenome]|uniref:Putative esterase n=1 Tax=bioreactor metagenome TaxID=1076179 RepID=A0A644YM55_9ZZZZ|nr:acyl-CoA thioesterase [Petrimonas sp.]MEA5044357.1 acyl-CoA thioesterase [Petrimonas sp.]MEA5064161.1 acyl-CoA thioesterase [Petrimonas sp.]
MNKYIFSHQLKVRDYECDTQGHVNNANYQHYFEVTRHEFLEKAGLNFHQLHKQGIDAVVSRVEIRYKVPLIGMDEFICTISRLERVGLKYIFHQEIVRQSDKVICARAKIEVVNLVNGKLSPPEVFDKAFKVKSEE